MNGSLFLDDKGSASHGCKAPMGTRISANVLINGAYWQRVIEDLLKAPVRERSSQSLLRRADLPLLRPASTTLRILAHRNRSNLCDLRLRCPSRTPEIASDFRDKKKGMLHCDLRVRWKVASDLRFQVAISEAETPSFCGISGDLAR